MYEVYKISSRRLKNGFWTNHTTLTSSKEFTNLAVISSTMASLLNLFPIGRQLGFLHDLRIRIKVSMGKFSQNMSCNSLILLKKQKEKCRVTSCLKTTSKKQSLERPGRQFWR